MLVLLPLSPFALLLVVLVLSVLLPLLSLLLLMLSPPLLLALVLLLVLFVLLLFSLLLLLLLVSNLLARATSTIWREAEQRERHSYLLASATAVLDHQAARLLEGLRAIRRNFLRATSSQNALDTPLVIFL